MTAEPAPVVGRPGGDGGPPAAGGHVAALELPADVVDLLRDGATCYLTTLMPDGSPQITQTWVDTDGTHVLINTVIGHRKVRNVELDPRVAVAVSLPSRPSRYVEIRGVVTGTSTADAGEHIEELAQRYLGGPYPWFGGRTEQRVVLRITPTRLNRMG
ncbi:PPOX class F420-dependent oxidoreductase [Blastococcus xanthinilyticus]|uniref:PPOX class probable F420-dependent enzyme n=1 Tax=Blastococcus xanthinilyticus TaxID=1564164 RepID=A0A5S5CT80_9ACTN|nr:PPOX class F420-dependent oxidoreductase [Blastococcus xanthinilyticus]TYP86923.1 PPOX class probable F420-dependent enzyme [Blastococcus xanthinilyticus]